MHPSLLKRENLPNSPIEEGDAGVVLKRDGTFQLFNTHKNLDPNNLTPRQIEQGRTLAAFAAALQIPAIMDKLYELSEDPALFEVTLNVGKLDS